MPMIPLFWTFGDVGYGFQSQGESGHLLPSLFVCDGFLRYICGVTPADLLAVNMAAKRF